VFYPFLPAHALDSAFIDDPIYMPSTLAWKAIVPFLNDSIVLYHSELASAPTVLGIDDDHLLIEECHRFFAAIPNPKLGDRYGIYKGCRNFLDPCTGCFLGKEALLLGVARIVEKGCPGRGGYTSTLVLESVKEEIKIGDKLLPYKKTQITPCFHLRIPDNNPCGMVLAGLGRMTQIGLYDVIVITGGKDQDRRPGDYLGIYQSKHDEPTRLVRLNCFRKLFCTNACIPRFLPQKVGELMVFKTFDKVSFGLVINSVRPIYLQDEVKRP